MSDTRTTVLRRTRGTTAGRVLSRAQLMDHAWDYDFGGSGGVVSTYIAYLRRKLAQHGPDPIRPSPANEGNHPGFWPRLVLIMFRQPAPTG
jgi:hypothetical protein